jgi:DNA-binding GntR family transcriptional regulator
MRKPLIRKRSDWKSIAEALQLDIIVGRLQLREHLVEDELMRRFNVSRYSVRRAIDEMQALGLVLRSENKGARIRSYTNKEVVDLFELREVLESGAALKIPMPVPNAVIDQLIAIQEQHDLVSRRGDFYKLFTLNNDFHQTLFSCCGNEQLSKAIASYSLQVQPIRMRFVHDKVRRQQVSVEHWEMIKAIQKEDRKALARLCGRHIALTKKLYLDQQRGVSERIEDPN